MNLYVYILELRIISSKVLVFLTNYDFLIVQSSKQSTTLKLFDPNLQSSSSYTVIYITLSSFIVSFHRASLTFLNEETMNPFFGKTNEKIKNCIIVLYSLINDKNYLNFRVLCSFLDFFC